MVNEVSVVFGLVFGRNELHSVLQEAKIVMKIKLKKKKTVNAGLYLGLVIGQEIPDSGRSSFHAHLSWADQLYERRESNA